MSEWPCGAGSPVADLMLGCSDRWVNPTRSRGTREEYDEGWVGGSDIRPALTSVLIAFCSIDIKSFENGDLIYAKQTQYLSGL